MVELHGFERAVKACRVVLYTDQERDSDRPATPWYSMTLSGLR